MSSLIDKVKRDYYLHGEAAKVIGVSRVSLWTWIKQGKVQAHRIGREVLIEKAEAERLRRS